MSQDENTFEQGSTRRSTKPALSLDKILDLLNDEGYTGNRFVSLELPNVSADAHFNPAQRMKEDPDSLAFAHVLEDSLKELGIQVGDMLCIDKTAAPEIGDFVVATEGGTVIYRFLHENDLYELRPVNPLLDSIYSEIPASFGIWGVVKQVMRAFDGNNLSHFHLSPEPTSEIIPEAE